jgi:hypothetical protein
MLDVAWRLGATLAALAGLAFLGSNVSCNPEFYLVDGAWGQTPQVQIASYLAAFPEVTGRRRWLSGRQREVPARRCRPAVPR